MDMWNKGLFATPSSGDSGSPSVNPIEKIKVPDITFDQYVQSVMSPSVGNTGISAYKSKLEIQ